MVQPRRLKRILQVAVVVAFTVFFLWLFLKNANLGDVWAILRSASPLWVVGGLITNWWALVFRTARWRTILDSENPPPFYPTFFATTVGYMLSTILPIRASDVARPALLSRRTSVRFSGALGTVLTERVLDLISILLLFVIFSLRHWSDWSHDPKIRPWFFVVRTGAIASAVLLAGLFFFIFGLYFFRKTIRRLHEWVGRIVPQRFRASWMHFFDAFVDTLSLASKHGAFAKVLACTAGIWFCLTTQFWFATMSLHRPLPFDSSFFVTGVTTVGLAIPTPGGVGGFHKACQLVLTNFYRMDIDSSVAIAVIFHLIGTLPVIVTGLLLFAREGLRWRDVAPQ